MKVAKLVMAVILGCGMLSVAYAEAPTNPRIGFGQAAANEPPMLNNMQLNDPLVQRKYANDPDMMRFLRAAYSEACSRGLMVKAATQVKLDTKSTADPRVKDGMRRLLESNRIWKMTTFEMEMLFQKAYLKSANYCDCMMKEVADLDLVNPKKGLEVIERIPPATQQACERIADEKTDNQALLPTE